jgi:diaminohydroxyphosphoribosylaminopyrimidine deaminase/5-amino-6-(5-phosphoribosylamino)uracil reductase
VFPGGFYDRINPQNQAGIPTPLSASFMTNLHDKTKLGGAPDRPTERMPPSVNKPNVPGRSINAVEEALVHSDDFRLSSVPHYGVPDGSAKDDWATVPDAFRAGEELPPRWEDLFGTLRTGSVDDLVVVGQLGQSLDGRIATANGHSHYINGLPGRAHLHRLRALVDAVVVGVGTAVADDPQLTVRLVNGPHPARVVLDPRGRLPASARLLAQDGVRRIVVTTPQAEHRLCASVEIVAIDAPEGRIAPAAILARLATCGLRRVLVEGGADTVSRFLSAGCLDRLHVMVAPIILGGGRPGLTLQPIERVDQALRPQVRAYPLGEDVLFDCDLSGRRRPLGWANKST